MSAASPQKAMEDSMTKDNLSTNDTALTKCEVN